MYLGALLIKFKYYYLQEPVSIMSKALMWQKVDPSDHLYVPEPKEEACKV